MRVNVPLRTATNRMVRRAQMSSGPPEPYWRRIKLRDPHEPVTNPLPHGEAPTSTEDLRVLQPGEVGYVEPGPGSLGDAEADERINIPQDDLKQLRDNTPEFPGNVWHQDFYPQTTEPDDRPLHGPKRTHNVYDSQQDELILESDEDNNFVGTTYPYAASIKLSSAPRMAQEQVSAWIIGGTDPIWIEFGGHAEAVVADPDRFGLSEVPPGPEWDPAEPAAPGELEQWEEWDNDVINAAVEAGNIRFDTGTGRLFFNVPQLNPTWIRHVQNFILDYYDDFYTYKQISVGTSVGAEYIAVELSDFLEEKPGNILRMRQSSRNVMPRTAILKALAQILSEEDEGTMDLINRFKKGDLDAGDQLVRQSIGLIKEIVNRRAYRFNKPVFGPQDIDDLTQEATIAMLNALQRWDGRGSLSGYVWQATDYAVLDEIRVKYRMYRREPSLEGLTEPSYEGEAVAPVEPAVERGFEDVLRELQTSLDIDSILVRLPEKLRPAGDWFKKYYVEGRSYEEIRAETGYDYNWIRKRIGDVVGWLKQQPEISELTSIARRWHVRSRRHRGSGRPVQLTVG